jgi:hypothetical protein
MLCLSKLLKYYETKITWNFACCAINKLSVDIVSVEVAEKEWNENYEEICIVVLETNYQ